MDSIYCENDRFVKEIKNLTKNYKNNISLTDTASINGINSVEKGSFHLESLLLTNATSGKIHKAFSSYILPAIYKTELFAGGGGHLSSLFYCLLFDEFYKNSSNVLSLYDKEEKYFLSLLNEFSTQVSGESIKEIIFYLCHKNKEIYNIIIESIDLAGIEGNISCENSNHQANYSIELANGYSFPVKIYKNLIQTLGGWEKNNVKLLCIDGIVDKVSELDNILRKSSESGIPMVIAAQGFSEEVIATIATNNNQNRFNIIPVILEQELENINVLNDIAICAKGDVVSVLKGQMLIYVNYDEIPTVESCKVTEKTLIIQNKITRNTVGNHINHLLDKKMNQQIIDGFNMGNFLDKRIKSLLTHAVKIKLPSTLSDGEKQTIRIKIDTTLRTLKTILSYGILTNNNLDTIEKHAASLKLKHWGRFLNEIKNSHTITPTLACYCSVFFNGNNLIKFLNSSGIIIPD